ncbi:MAG: hypothetical protein A3F16_00375 [Deltaproteobacteria bacterium RIFCSPHIGHO2_12_FULL_43_9]|nr:MAG: hypothetical protein A3F16_00375 [Deltaproteobacteria bacterium RIFCSPHIGHO2_12_FULL_43_9]
MKNHLRLQFFVYILLILATPSISMAGLVTGNYKPSNNDNTTSQQSNEPETNAVLEAELSGVVTGNFYEPEVQLLAQGVVTGNFRTNNEASPQIAAIAGGVVTGNFHTIGSAKIATDTWYESSDNSFKWLVTKDLFDNVEFLVETAEGKKYVIGVDIN